MPGVVGLGQLGQLFEYSKIQLQQGHNLFQMVSGAGRWRSRDRHGGGVRYWALIIFTVRGGIDPFSVHLSFIQGEDLFKGLASFPSTLTFTLF